MTKRILSTILLSVLFGCVSFSQIQLGAKGGINFAKVFPIPILVPGGQWTTLNGAVTGLIADYRISQMVTLQVEANFIQKGFSFTSDIANGTERVNYIEVPIGLKIMPMNSEIKPYLFAGVGLAAFLNAREKAKDYLGSTFDIDTKNNYKSGDYTAQIGIGLEYPLQPSLSAFVDGRYSRGLVTYGSYPGATLKTTGIEVQVGMLYSIN